MKKNSDKSGAGDGGKYAWSIYGNEELKLMPSGNRIVYFMHRRRGEVRPISALDRDERLLLMPPSSVGDVWKKFAISLLGYADHTKGYYHSRVNESFHDMLIVEKGVLGYHFQCLPGTSFRSESIGTISKVSFEYWLYCYLGSHLHNSVLDCWYSKRSFTSVWFWYHNSLYWGWFILSIHQFRFDF